MDNDTPEQTLNNVRAIASNALVDVQYQAGTPNEALILSQAMAKIISSIDRYYEDLGYSGEDDLEIARAERYAQERARGLRRR